jgi:hypothetical protein
LEPPQFLFNRLVDSPFDSLQPGEHVLKPLDCLSQGAEQSFPSSASGHQHGSGAPIYGSAIPGIKEEGTRRCRYRHPWVSGDDVLRQIGFVKKLFDLTT